MGNQKKRTGKISAGSYFTEDDVLVAVNGLYKDRVKPISRVLRKRVYVQLVEREQATSGIHVNCTRLRDICNGCSLLQVQDEELDDWSVSLVSQKPNFVDIYSSEDVYPVELWKDFAAFFEAPGSDDFAFPGGRLACAELLRSRLPSSFSHRSLGELCHIVELALSQKKIIGYKNGCMVPYRNSQLMIKEQLANEGSVGREVQEGGVRNANLKEARECLQQVLQEQPDGRLALPNVKRRILAQFKLQFNETAFGHSRVSDLLQDPRFDDICSVQLHGRGYMVISKEPHKQLICLDSVLPPAAQSSQSLSGATGDMSMERSSPRRVCLCADEPLLIDETDGFLLAGEPALLVPSPAPLRDESTEMLAPRWTLSPCTLSGMVRGPFIHAALPPPTPFQRSKRRTQSVPMDICRDVRH
jgi:hypothetical protein